MTVSCMYRIREISSGAYDAATGDVRWEHQRDLGERTRRGTNRNIAIYGNTIIDTSGDNHVFALDVATGEMVWETEILDPSVSANASSGPIIAGGKIIAGRQCQPAGGQEACIITAHDAETGEELWRTSTIPRPGEPGDETWGSVPYEERWHVGTWMVPSYDPELNLIYMGTSVTIPAPKFILGGNGELHLYHNSTLALDARHRRDCLVLSAPCRSLGPGPSVRTDGCGHGGYT